MASETGSRNVRILQIVEDHIADTGRLPSTTEIIDIAKIPGQQVRTALDQLVNQKELSLAYSLPKNPSIYVPTYMYEAMRRGAKTPDWIDQYRFLKGQELYDSIREQENELSKFNKLESLLYSTGRTLEDAVVEGLKTIGISNLEAPYESQNDMWDVSFGINGKIVISDVKGKSRWADKDDVAQLSLWLQRYVDENKDADPDNIEGVLIINSFRDYPPNERWPHSLERPPLSEAALKYLKVGGLKFLTTQDIFEIAKRVLETKISKKASISALVAAIKTTI